MSKLGLSSLWAGALVVCASVSAQAETVLTMSNYLPAGSFFNDQVIKVWADNVSEATQGRVKVNILPKVVGNIAQQYDVVVDGLADLALFNPGYSPGRFDITGIGEAPLLSPASDVAAVGFWRFYETELKPAGLFNEVELLSIFTTAPGHLALRSSPPADLAGLKGQKIRSPLPVTKRLLDAFGAVPVSKPVSEAYELMSTGVVDGTLLGYDTVIGFKLAEVSKGALEVPGGLYNASAGIAMNKEKFAALSPEDQAAINKVSGEALAKLTGTVYLTAIEDGKAALIAAGTDYKVADEAFLAEIKAAAEPIYADIAKLAEAAGLKDPQNVMARYQAILDQAATDLKAE